MTGAVPILIALTGAITGLLSLVHAHTNSGRDRAPAPPPQASMRQLMTGLIEPAADHVFKSASHVVNAAGMTTLSPSSPEQWAAVEGRASLLIDAAALLAHPGRDTTHRRLVALDRARWTQYAAALGQAAGWARDAARARDAERLIVAGGDLSLACERCHLAFRFPAGRRYLPPED